MTNYEWLLQMGGEERQAWFDAEHVEGVEIQGEPDEIDDSREKLEADVRNILKSAYMYAWMHGYENRRGSSFEKLHVEFYNLLDRQAAITERECIGDAGKASLMGVVAHERECFKKQIAELTAERDALADKFELYRSKLGTCADLAGEIRNVAMGFGAALVDKDGNVL